MISFINSKPILATITQVTTFSAWLSSILGIINPVLGFIAFLIFILIQLSKYRKQRSEEESERLKTEIERIHLQTIKEKHPWRIGDE